MSNTSMNNQTDLDWLARNVHEWPVGAKHAAKSRLGHAIFGCSVLAYGWFSKRQWLARRAELQNKPSWDDHQWPQIFQNEGGSWFGARSGWDFKAHISGGWKGEGVSLMRDDGEYLQSGTIFGDWRDTLEKRPEEFKPFTSIEDNQDQVLTQQQDNGWHERGELPPVGSQCEVMHRDSWVVCDVIAHFQQKAAMVAAYTVDNVNALKQLDSCIAKYFRPIRTERDVLIEIIKKTDDTDDKIADAILAAGFKRGAA